MNDIIAAPEAKRAAVRFSLGAIALVAAALALDDAAAETNGWSNGTGAFSITIPNGWVARSEPDALVTVSPEGLTHDEQRAVQCAVKIARADNVPGASQEHVNQSGAQVTRATVAPSVGGDIVVFENTIVAGVRVIGYEAALRSSQGTGLLRQRTFILVEGDRVTSYQLACIAHSSLQDRYAGDMLSVVESLSFSSRD
jgi:hypothetical protein